MKDLQRTGPGRQPSRLPDDFARAAQTGATCAGGAAALAMWSNR